MLIIYLYIRDDFLNFKLAENTSKELRSVYYRKWMGHKLNTGFYTKIVWIDQSQ